MPLNTAAQNPNTFNVLPASQQKIGTDRGWCSWFERPMTSNVFGDRIQIVDMNMQTFTWNGSAWINPTVIVDANNNVIGVPGPSGEHIGVVRLLKNFTGANQLTGGTVNTKTLLMEVPIPDNAMLDFRASLRISALFGFSLNTNSKSFGVDIGQSFGSGFTLWSRTRSSATSGADSLLVDIQRNPLSPGDFALSYGNSVAQEGQSNVNTASYVSNLTATDPTLAGQSLFFWGQLVTANTDQITLARARVEYCVAEA